MQTLSSLLRCETLEDCRRIQRGYLPLRRLGKWSVLFTIAVALVINDAVAVVIGRMILGYQNALEEYERFTGSVLYRWTAGWLMPELSAPEIDWRAIALYKTFNSLQFAIFVGWCLYCLRWVYADCRVQDGKLTFSKFCTVALITNILLYFVLRIWMASFFK